MKNEKLKFWIPYAGGFMVIPGEKNYLDGNFFNPDWLFIVFLAWHCIWVILPFALISL